MQVGDPRAVLSTQSQARGDSLAALSRMIGRNEAYLHQFVTRGSPRALDERDRRFLADHFGIDESLLGGSIEASRATRVGRLEAAASAGPGALVDDEVPVGSDYFDAALIRRLRLDSATARTLRVRGMSMAPGVLDGDVILVDSGDRRVDGGVFLLRIADALMVKRVRLDGRRAVATSDNPEADPLPAHRPDEIAILGRVVWLSRTPR